MTEFPYLTRNWSCEAVPHEISSQSMSMTINRVQIETLRIGKIVFEFGIKKKENLSENKVVI